MRSYSSRVIVCLVALVESSTTKVDRALRESTLVFTTTLPNSVRWLFGIFSVSSRSRSVVGLHSTDAALTSYTTTPPPGACAVAPSGPAATRWQRHLSRGIWGVYPDKEGSNARRTCGLA